ncbi:MAG: VCBS repeat-containing protein [Cyclobacteriaceae bacterium]
MIYKIKYLVLFTWMLLAYSCQKENPDALFTELSSSQTGVAFKNLVRESEEFNVLTYGYFYQGGGVAIGDVNNDGLPDLYFTGNMMASKLYLNKGEMVFEDITESAGVAASGLWNTGVAMADINGDGFLDIYICRSAANDPNNRRNLLFINQGDLTFIEQAVDFGVDDPGFSTQASFFDYDRDGDLDMFLLNHSTQEYAGFSRIDGSFKQKTGPYIGDKLYQNQGGKFVDVTKESGINNNVLGFGLAVTVSDVDNDGWLDVYVSNDYNEEDYLYINQQDGTFKESIRDYMGHVSLFSMGADGADLNNDLHSDIITMDMMPEYNYNQKTILGPENYDKYQALLQKGFHAQTMRNMLQLNQGNGSFTEIGQYAGISHTDWSWAVLAADFDNDGWKDIFITNGYARNYLDMDFMNYLVSERMRSNQEEKEEALTELIDKMPPIYVANYLYHNNGDLTFSNRAEEWGLGALTVSNAAAYADLDGDGDLDLVVSHTNDPVSIYRNNSERLYDRAFLKVKLEGKDQNTSGIGAKVLVYASGQTFHQELMPVRGYQSSVDHELVFGLGNLKALDSLVVYWPDGSRQVIKEAEMNTTLILDQKEALPYEQPSEKIVPLYMPVEDALGIDFVHRESEELDFKRDRLMPNTMSTTGPKISLADVNGDGLEDIYLGGGKDQAGQLFLQDQSGKFSFSQQKAFQADSLSADTDAVFGDFNGDGSPDLYVVSGGSDFSEGDVAYQDRLYINDGRGNFSRKNISLSDKGVSGSTVTVGDINGDGHLDIFVGGRFRPGSYPLPPRSYLLLNDGEGNFQDATPDMCPELMMPGLVTDALFMDINGDRHDDLVLVGEWMGVQVFLNEEGKSFRPSHPELAEKTRGWWLSLEAADLDDDGDMDLVAGNYGKNIVFKPKKEQPIRLTYKDFDGNGSIDPILTYYMADTNAIAFSRDEMIGQIPMLKRKYSDYQSFAKASTGDFFEQLGMDDADTLKVNMLASVYLENVGGNFTIHELPEQAQFSPIFAFEFDDLNGDGRLEMMTGGNLSRTRVSTGQLDANPGFVLAGEEDGVLKLLPLRNTGISLKGNVRAIQKISIKDKNYLIYTFNNQGLKVFEKR